MQDAPDKASRHHAPENLSQSGNQSSLGIMVRAADCRAVVTTW
jgi:hypothetical protein